MENETEKIVFGGGCFWCTEAVFLLFKGVIKTTVGYAGGTTSNPTYEQVCEGITNHAEVLQIEYDPKVIGLEKLLDIFFNVHNPTLLNRQGGDVGTQYRSIILYISEKQKNEINSFIARIKNDFDKPIVTEVKALEKFYTAEDYHQNYYTKNPNLPYCSIVIGIKIDRIKKKYGIS